MPPTSRTWGAARDDEAVAELVDRATFDWTDIGALVGKVGRRLGDDAPFPTMVAAMGELVGVLIDHDILPGDLGVDPDFQPWPGTRQDRVDRVVREAIALGTLPRPGDIAWFHHVPPADQPDATIE